VAAEWFPIQGKAVGRGQSKYYAYKYLRTGEVERHKARYVAMGCMQEEGRDYHSDALREARSGRTPSRSHHIGLREGDEV